MAAYLLRLSAVTLASMVLSLLLTLADRAPLLIPGLVGVGGILAGAGLLFLGAVCTAAVWTRWRSRPPRPGPTLATTTGGERR